MGLTKTSRFGMLMTLLFVGLAPGWQVYLLAEDACPEQPDYRTQARRQQVLTVANESDPNLSRGAVVSPYPDDPNRWAVQEGPWKRDWTKSCDRQGDSYTIRLIEGTSPAEVQRDIEQGLWSFSAVVYPGLNSWCFETDDSRPNGKRYVWVLAMGIGNDAPIICWWPCVMEVS